MRTFGWDLPPGCRISDIPGNRPEDEKWEAIEENFYDKERLLNPKFGIRISEKEYALMDELAADPKYSDVVTTYISAAIEYGMDIGKSEAFDTQAENKFFETPHIEEVLTEKGYTPKQVHDIMVITGFLKEA